MRQVGSTSCYLHGGPNHGQTIEVDADIGLVPEEIEVQAVEADPEKPGSLKVLKGVYTSSPFGEHIYQWKGWTDADPS